METATALDHKLKKRLERGLARKQQQQQAEEEGRGARLGPEEQKAAGPRAGGGLKGLLQQQSRAQGGKVRREAARVEPRGWGIRSWESKTRHECSCA